MAGCRSASVPRRRMSAAALVVPRGATGAEAVGSTVAHSSSMSRLLQHALPTASPGGRRPVPASVLPQELPFATATATATAAQLKQTHSPPLAATAATATWTWTAAGTPLRSRLPVAQGTPVVQQSRLSATVPANVNLQRPLQSPDRADPVSATVRTIRSPGPPRFRRSSDASDPSSAAMTARGPKRVPSVERSTQQSLGVGLANFANLSQATQPRHTARTSVVGSPTRMDVADRGSDTRRVVALRPLSASRIRQAPVQYQSQSQSQGTAKEWAFVQQQPPPAHSAAGLAQQQSPLSHDRETEGQDVGLAKQLPILPKQGWSVDATASTEAGSQVGDTAFAHKPPSLPSTDPAPEGSASLGASTQADAPVAQVLSPVLGEAEWARLKEVSEATAMWLAAEEETAAALASVEGVVLSNPLETGVYTAPVMSEEECAAVTLKVEEVKERLSGILQEHGVAVVTGVVGREELTELEAALSQDLADLVDEEGLSRAKEGVRAAHRRFQENGLQCFPRATMPQFARAAGFLQGRGLPQGRLPWAVRRHPNVRAVFEELFPGEQGGLVASLGSTFFTPSGVPAAEQSSFNPHVDQNAHDVRPGLASMDEYQGVLYVWPAGADGQSTTTAVWPGSHREVWPLLMQDQSFVEAGRCGFHYCEVGAMHDYEQAALLAGGWARHARRCVVPAGGLLLWNSKTLHTGWKGGPRLAQTICFEPASRRAEIERIAKLRLVALGLPSCHWSSICMQHDMCLGEPGSLATKGNEAEELVEGDPDEVVLPLKPSITSPALEDHADLQRLASLVRVDYRPGLIGLWDATQEQAELLEASIRQEYKCYL